MKSCGQWETAETSANHAGQSSWETSGDKWNAGRESRVSTGREVGTSAKSWSRQGIQGVDKGETTGMGDMRAKAPKHPERIGRGAKSVVGDKGPQCDPASQSTQSTQIVLGHKWRQVGTS